MSDARFKRYVMSVLAYYRSEWTEVLDHDTSFAIFLSKDLKTLIRDCMQRGVNVPDAAKEVHTFVPLSNMGDTKISKTRDTECQGAGGDDAESDS